MEVNMQVDTLLKAISEAERFITTARKVNIETVNGTHAMAGKTWKVVGEYTKESAACRRASLDLTRALADLRQGR